MDQQLKAQRLANVEDLQRQSNAKIKGPLGNLLGRSFEFVATVIRDGVGDTASISFALETFATQRRLAYKHEEGKTDPLRIVIYEIANAVDSLVEAIMQQQHAASAAAADESINAERMRNLEHWRVQSPAIVKGPLGMLLSRTFEFVATIAKDGVGEDTSFALESFMNNRDIAYKRDQEKTDPLRELVYGIAHSVGTMVQSIMEERAAAPAANITVKQELMDHDANAPETTAKGAHDEPPSSTRAVPVEQLQSQQPQPVVQPVKQESLPVEQPRPVSSAQKRSATPSTSEPLSAKRSKSVNSTNTGGDQMYADNDDMPSSPAISAAVQDSPRRLTRSSANQEKNDEENKEKRSTRITRSTAAGGSDAAEKEDKKKKEEERKSTRSSRNGDVHAQEEKKKGEERAPRRSTRNKEKGEFACDKCEESFATARDLRNHAKSHRGRSRRSEKSGSGEDVEKEDKRTTTRNAISSGLPVKKKGNRRVANVSDVDDSSDSSAASSSSSSSDDDSDEYVDEREEEKKKIRRRMRNARKEEKSKEEEKTVKESPRKDKTAAAVATSIIGEQFKCKKCPRSFSAQSSLSAHIQRSHWGIQCNFCKMRLAEDKLDSHMASDHPDKPWTKTTLAAATSPAAARTAANTASNAPVTSQTATTTPAAPPAAAAPPVVTPAADTSTVKTLLKCLKCQRIFDTQIALSQHTQRAHWGIKCDYCKHQFSEDKLANHMQKDHPDKPPYQPKKEDANGDAASATVVRASSTFLPPSRASSSTTVTSSTTAKVEVTTPTASPAAVAAIVVAPMSYKCDKCPRVFDTPRGRNHHAQQHWGVKCDYCPIRVAETKLAEHMQKVHPEKPAAKALINKEANNEQAKEGAAAAPQAPATTPAAATSSTAAAPAAKKKSRKSGEKSVWDEDSDIEEDW